MSKIQFSSKTGNKQESDNATTQIQITIPWVLIVVITVIGIIGVICVAI